MAFLNDYQYYENNGNPPQNENWGSYQYMSLEDIVNTFMTMYVGNDKLINNVERYNVLFHAKRAIQELNYDSLKEIKILELEVGDTLRYILPSDYVNWVRISMYKDGCLYPLTENKAYQSEFNLETAITLDLVSKILSDVYSYKGILVGFSFAEMKLIRKLYNYSIKKLKLFN